MSLPNLSPRHGEVLSAIILNYLVTGSPVGSRLISRHSRDGLSSATIRNTMADLEEMGYLMQPHTSAGRVPTDQGYRYYVDRLMSERSLTRHERRIISRVFPRAGEPVDLHDLLGRTAKLLAGLSSHVGVILAPRFSHAVLRRLEFLGLADRRVLAIFVSNDGLVDHRVIQVPEDLKEHDLQNMTNLVNENFQGMTLPQIRTRLLQMMSEEKALYDRMLARALELSRSYLETREGEENEVIVDGASNVLGAAGFADAQRMKDLFRTFEDKHRLVGLLNACLERHGPRIVIGSESPDPGFSDLTLISSPYREGEEPVGVLGIIGPRRMEYDRLVTVVGSLSRLVSEALARRASGPAGGGEAGGGPS